MAQETEGDSAIPENAGKRGAVMQLRLIVPESADPNVAAQARETVRQIVEAFDVLSEEFPSDQEFGFVIRGKMNELRTLAGEGK